jgi:hypothetical protein
MEMPCGKIMATQRDGNLHLHGENAALAQYKDKVAVSAYGG